MQAYPEKYKNGVIAAARDIVATEGLGFLLTGLGPTVIGYGLEGALKFGCYETFKQVFKTLTPYKVANFLLASVLAGAVASVVLVSNVTCCSCHVLNPVQLNLSVPDGRGKNQNGR